MHNSVCNLWRKFTIASSKGRAAAALSRRSTWISLLLLNCLTSICPIVSNGSRNLQTVARCQLQRKARAVVVVINWFSDKVYAYLHKSLGTYCSFALSRMSRNASNFEKRSPDRSIKYSSRTIPLSVLPDRSARPVWFRIFILVNIW